MGKYHQGKISIVSEKYKQKYIGDLDNIIYRSSWEKDFIVYLFRNNNVINLSSEEIIIPYFNPVKNRMAKYYMDFWFRFRDKDNKIRMALVEVKPYYQTQNPKMTYTKTGRARKKRYSEEVLTYNINRAKWKAAYQFCIKNNMKFYILTEQINRNSNSSYTVWSYEELFGGYYER
jgi:hypothetical protein